jgi:hypothetical protein
MDSIMRMNKSYPPSYLWEIESRPQKGFAIEVNPDTIEYILNTAEFQ